jgi:hypothetical protein
MSGLSHTPGKRAKANNLPRVRIPPSPPAAANRSSPACHCNAVGSAAILVGNHFVNLGDTILSKIVHPGICLVSPPRHASTSEITAILHVFPRIALHCYGSLRICAAFPPTKHLMGTPRFDRHIRPMPRYIVDLARLTIFDASARLEEYALQTRRVLLDAAVSARMP